jgi:hydroxypyruvate isomerase
MIVSWQAPRIQVASTHAKGTSAMATSRREFIGTAAAAAAGGVLSQRAANASGKQAEQPFHLKFAPHPGMFRNSAGNDVIDQIAFSADQGFTAWEFNGLPNETVETQESVGNALASHNMTMGVFVAFASFDAPVFARPSKEGTAEVLQSIRDAVTIAKRVNAKWVTVVPGSVDQQVASEKGRWNKYGGGRLATGYQTANTIDLLRRCSEILEPHDLVMVLEPLNWHANHGGTLLRYSDQAYALCRAVNSPSCKILFDIYHQQITEGNLIPNIDLCWDEIGYFQSGDNPGRKEPGTGEIHYGNVFSHIAKKSRETGREFVIGMEHGNSQRGKPGEQAVIDAYRAVDPDPASL